MSDTVDPKMDELAKSVGINVQPPPMTTGNPSAHDLLAAYIKSKGFNPPPVPFDKVDFGIKDLAIIFLTAYCKEKGTNLFDEVMKRKEFGLKKYGTPLTVGNGREHMEDAMQELIDFLVYYICWEDETYGNKES